MKKQGIILLIAICIAFNLLAQQKVADYSVSTKYGFIENKGQIMDQDYNPNPDVKYLFPGNGVKVQLLQQGFSYDVVKYVEKERPFSEATGWEDEMLPSKFQQPKEYDVHVHRIDIELVGSNPDAQLVPVNPAPDYINYYNSITPDEGATLVRHYDKVVYKDIYPHIDMEFIVTEDQGIKYNFIVNAGGDYRDIKLQYNGANGMRFKEDTLFITTAHTTLKEAIPYSYQLIDGMEHEVKVHYTQLGEGIFGFKPLSKLTPGTALVIDPVLIWGTYYGGFNWDSGWSVATDADDNVFLAGLTRSTSGIAFFGYQNVHGGGNVDAFLVKFNSSGIREWATYYGGSGLDEAFSLDTDLAGNVFLAGHTYSTSGIASGGHQNVYGGGDYDAFLVKFNNSGIRQWATYYGGSGRDFTYYTKTDDFGNVYLTGHTSSPTGISLNGHQNTLGGIEDAFLVKFNSNGVRIWATYYGGNHYDYGRSITVDFNGNVFLAGETSSTSGIAINGYQNLHGGGGNSDAFLVKFNSSGVVQWATYYGGSGSDGSNSVEIDANGNIFLAGRTESFFGISLNGYQNIYGGGIDAILAKFTSNGVLQWATYYGGNGEDYVFCVKVDVNGNIFLAGSTTSTSNIAFGGYQNSIGGSLDAFLVKFNEFGYRQWATYYGAGGEDNGRSITINTDGDLYLAGFTESTSGIAYGGHLNTYGGGPWDAFLAKFWGGGIITPNSVKGKIFADVNSNCVQDTNDINRQQIFVKAEPGPYYGVSDSSGNYIIYLPDTGSYTVSVATQDTVWLLSCSTSYNVQLTSTPDTVAGIDFAMSAAYYCPRLKVDVGIPLLRRCFTNIYSFSYSNTGTLPASGVYVEVDFGQHFQPQNSSIPWSSVSGNIYTFPIGNLNINQQGSFNVTGLLSCTAELGSTQCVTARILPNSPCDNPDPVFDRSQLYMYGQCVAGDSVEYKIWNQHTTITHSGYFELYVNSALLDSIPFSLVPGDTVTLKFPANGNTLRLEVKFISGSFTFPGPQYTVEACGPNPVFGHVTTLPQNDDPLYIETFCMTVIGAWDPNDKQVFPQGITSNKFIKEDTELEYLIRFQNTGTDTAFTVVIRDTLSSFLDIPSIQLGSSSHSYEFNIYGQGIAEWTFNNILLPDSHINEPASHGYVKYKIRQKAGNSPGTVIENRAGIYFDFNEPVITNTVFNTVYDTVLICQKPVTQFTFSQDGSQLTLNNQTISGQSYVWNFGDGNSSVQPAPVHVFDQPASYNVCLTSTNACGATTKCETILITHAESIELNLWEKVTLYPNPTRNSATVEWDKAIRVETITIQDIYGKLIEEITVNEQTQLELDLTNHARGIYFITIKGNGSRILKLVKLE